MCIAVQQLSYLHPDREILLREISFSILKGDKTALIGQNGSGKSTLLQIMAGRLAASSGDVICRSTPYYVPQHFGQYDCLTIAGALQIDRKLDALQAILNGDVSAGRFTALNDDWDIEARAYAALSEWGLAGFDFSRPLSSLSGGEKTRVFLAGITLHTPETVLLDEPTNHLDATGRASVYDWIGDTRATVVVVSHDRTLLNLVNSVYELDRGQAIFYAGNYDAYRQQREVSERALLQQIDDGEKALRLARKKARGTAERQQKHNVRGEKRSARSGIGKMAMNTLKDHAEKSTSKLVGVHAEKLASLANELSEIRSVLPDVKAMKVDFGSSGLHTGKILVTADHIDYAYGGIPVWKEPLSFRIRSGERIRITGRNGCGKSTLLKLIVGALRPTAGELTTAAFRWVWLDQEYSMIGSGRTVFEQVRQYNGVLTDPEIKSVLTRFLFPYAMWDQDCARLSGGEKMKLTLCCLMVIDRTPDLFLLDEPTNNIDIRNAEILTATLRDYRGTVCVVSHDNVFVREIGIDRCIGIP